MSKEKILQFKQVYVWVKRRKLIKLFYSNNLLQAKEMRELQSDLRKIEVALNRLEHLRSIVGHILLRS